MASKLSYYYEMCRRIDYRRALPKLYNYVKYRCLKRQATTSVRQYAPQIATLMCTMRCNLNCGYCSMAKILREGRGGGENEASLEKVKKIFSNPLFAKCLLVQLAGGEPLLISDLEKIISYLAKRGHIVSMITNGMLLAERIEGLKRAGIFRINVSLYDANRKILEHDLPKINGIFPVHISIVLTRSEVESGQQRLLETVRFVHDAGCRGLRFWIYRPMGDNPRPEEIISDSLPAYVELRRLVDEAFPGFCFWPTVVKIGKVAKRCTQLWQIGCDMSGKMTICCGSDMMLPGPDNNLFDGEPDKVFNHPLLVAMRRQLLDPNCPPPEICKNCNLLDEPGW